MAVTITHHSCTIIYVNGKQVYRDADGDWLTRAELTTSEQQALEQHLNHL